MNRVAFYAPMKPPDHPTPSGDRSMARNLVAALEAAQCQVTLASRLQTRDGEGCAETQKSLMAAADLEILRLVAQGRAAGWQVWVTYHNYYKAPDLVGPRVAQALNIPYVLAEATRARKRLDGAWAVFADAAETACDAADAILYLTERDAEALRRDAPAGQQLVHLAPFLPLTDLPRRGRGGGGVLCAGMMRRGDKLESYRIIAATLAGLRTHGWTATIAGDGAAHSEVVDLMSGIAPHVHFRGACTEVQMDELYDAADVFFWPGVNEAFGMVYLEAQARGVPVVAQDRPGVRDVLAPGERPAPQAGSAALAAQIDRLLSDRAAREAQGAAARAYVSTYHLLGGAASLLARTIKSVCT